MNRRHLLLAALAVLAVAGTGAAGLRAWAFRLHRTPGRSPFLTETHLEAVRAQFRARDAEGAPPRVLFIGNSNLLNHDVPGRVAALAAAEGRPIRHAVAAAGGARLVESASIDALRAIVSDLDWDVVVLQEFSKTALRSWDRWASRRTVAQLAALARPAAVVLMPSWPYRPGHPIYAGEVGWFESAPDDPADFVSPNEVLFRRVAADHDLTTAPIGQSWLGGIAEGWDLYEEDGQHASAAGADLAARILWDSIRTALDGRL